MRTYLFIVIFLFLGLMYFYNMCMKDMKKRQSASRRQKEEDVNALIDNVCRNVNNHIESYNNLITEAGIIINEKRSEISSANDMNAMTEYKLYVVEYQEQQELVLEKLESIKRILEDEKDFEKAFQQNRILKEDIDQLSHIIEKIKYIEVHRVSFADSFKRTSYTETQNKQKELSFFAGCETKTEADKRYRNLSKAFHPDTGCGDAELFQKMTEEYESLKF